MSKTFCLHTTMLALLLSSLIGSSGSANELRIMSFNLRYGTANDGENHWDKRKEFVAETIHAYAPDLLGTQETLEFQKEFLSKKMPAYTSVGVGRDRGDQSGEMTALFFKTERFELLEEGHFWLSETPRIPGSKSWDTSLTRMCSWVRLQDRVSESKRPILFMNTHFDHRGSDARLQSARLLRKKADELGDGCDIVLTGDFNAAADSEPYRALFSELPGETVFLDTYATKRPADESGEATFSGFKSSTLEGSRIDWIAIRGSWTLQEAAIDRTGKEGRTPSDHYPVTAILSQANSTR
ncbi:endonuclease/exonuclease/phosphatase family protein [Novipirellula artificiosorum]|uniref:Endonuclease/Exonuclease/phosphatase family protein n=1 Tax=Novipirellula artificiosorum TaxID=2528016 RepID=A0A5C6E095_9BACT|nr:endonuclease/exonuclease/phosphatase family protein [Novipirellula artificiosorum]TWU42280.1 Endonuclease/Exonuclease/phosphatase family protein [Novipirellula artificiosorum]